MSALMSGASVPSEGRKDFCRRGVVEAQRRKAERLRREALTASGVNELDLLLARDHYDLIEADEFQLLAEEVWRGGECGPGHAQPAATMTALSPRL